MSTGERKLNPLHYHLAGEADREVADLIRWLWQVDHRFVLYPAWVAVLWVAVWAVIIVAVTR